LNKVDFSKVEKDLKKIPGYIRDKLFSWALAVELEGILEIRKLPGYHDEPLKGERRGQRSIRLSRSYRAIYIENLKGELNLISIIEVNKHEY
jgi:proteic killer suppression protein